MTVVAIIFAVLFGILFGAIAYSTMLCAIGTEQKITIYRDGFTFDEYDDEDDM